MKADRTKIEKKARNRKMEEKLEAQLRELAGMIDHTILKPDATKQKVLEVFREVNDAVTAYRNMRRTAELKFNLKEAARQYVVLAKLQ